jgi:hypothetical protein
MDALQLVFRAVDRTVRDGHLVDDSPPWEEPVKVTPQAPVPQAKPPEKPPEPPKNSGLSDEEGLRRAYASPDNIYVDGDRMYVAGTTPSPLGDSLASTVRNTREFIQDWTDNIEKLPLNLTKATKRYQQAYRALVKNPQVTTLIGHSLGGAVVNEMGVSEPDKYKTRSYSAPVFRWDLPNDENHQRFRTLGDPVASMDRWANVVKKDSWNPISLHDFRNFAEMALLPGHMPREF